MQNHLKEKMTENFLKLKKSDLEMANVIVYSTETCPHCVYAKDFLKKNKIKFTDYNVNEDHDKAREMIKKSGQTGVPVLDIDGKIIIGFDEDEIKKALKIK